jgi:hypothetical protein
MTTTSQLYELLITQLDWKLKTTEERYALVQELIQKHEHILVDYQSTKYHTNNTILKKSDFLFEEQSYGKIMDILINYILFFEPDILNDQQQKYRDQQEHSKEPKEQKTYRKALRKEVLDRVNEKDVFVRGEEKERRKVQNKAIQENYHHFIAPQPVNPAKQQILSHIG